MQHENHITHIVAGAGLFCLVFLGASCSSKVDGGVFVSADIAETWEQRVFVAQEKKKTITIDALNIENVFFDPKDPTLVYLASKDAGLFKSTNAGEQWTQLPVAAQRVRDMSINVQETNELYVTLGTTIIKSSDAGEHWETIYTDPRNATIMRVEVDWFQPSRVFAATSIGNVLLSSDSGVNWTTSLTVDEPISDLIVDPVDSRILYAVELDHTIYKTTDGGLTWTPLITEDTLWTQIAEGPVGDTTAEAKRVKAPSVFRTLIMDPNNHLNLFFTSNQGIARSTDGGLNWAYLDTLIARGASENSSIRSFMVLPGDSDTYIFSLGRIIHKSTDAGKTWKTIENFPSSRVITILAASANTSERIFAGTEEVAKKKGIFGF